MSGARSTHGQTLSHSPIMYYRLASNKESLASEKEKPAKKRGSLQKQNLVDSSSEESGGVYSSMDSLSTPASERKVHKSPPSTGHSKIDRKKLYKRSRSGSDIITPAADKAPLIPHKDQVAEEGADENRHSFPSSKSVSSKSVQVKPEYLLPASSSFSTPDKKILLPQKPSLSSQSFSSPKPQVRPSRSFLLDPKVDLRAAVKPSTVKKKRNPGILFSLNNMLNKKVEKMKKSNSRK